MSINQVYDYAEAGFRVFALWGIRSDGTCACPDQECISVGKHPRINGWNKTPFQDDDQIEAMQEFLVDTGYGVCLDAHLVIDIDPRHDGDKSYDRLKSDLGIDLDAESGCIVATGGGGLHVYFSVPADMPLMAHHKDYPGIDFKCGNTGGSFVVGAGSLHASGTAYEFSKGNPDDLTPCPDALLALLERKQSSNKTYDGEVVTDSEIEALLSHIPNDDLHYEDWIKVGMAIHDATDGTGFALWDEWSMQSTKYSPDFMDRKWHSFGKSANPVRIGSLFHMAEQNGFVREVTFDSPELESPAAEPEPKPKHVRMLEALQASDDDEMARVANMKWVIDGLIPAESFGVVFGEPGGGKSFTAVDMACAISTGEPWQGLDTGDEGLVIYISAEGGNGMRFRKRAWEQQHKKAPLMRVLPMATILDDKKDLGMLLQVLREYQRGQGIHIKAIIVDTLNRSMLGNENDNTDMAAFVRGCEALQHSHQCSVIVIHHSGKDADKGARGASALKAATDFEIQVSKKDAILTISNTRAKDVEPLPPVLCKLEKVTISNYTDYKGRPITSLVPSPASLMDSVINAGKLSEREQVLLDIIRELSGSGPICSKKDAKTAFCEKEGLSNTSGRQAFKRTMDELADRELAHIDGDNIVLDEF